MKVLFALMSLVVIVGGKAFGQNPVLHAVYFVDTRDKEIGSYCRKDLVYVNERLANMAKVLSYDYKAIIDTADNFKAANFEALADILKPGEADIIVLYVSSHGAAQGNAGDQFPKISFGGGSYSPVSVLHNKLKTLKHKSLLTIVDACNNYQNLMYDISHGFGVGIKITELPKNSCMFHNYQKLFERPFDCILAASKPGDLSLTGPLGSLFTNIFFKQLDDMTMTCRLDESIGMRILINNVISSTSISSDARCAETNMVNKGKNQPVCKAFTPVEDLQFR